MLKKTVLFLICALPISLMAQQETKLGHVNMQEIFSQMPEQATIQKTLEDQQKEIETELAKLNEELTSKVKDFQDKQATMTETIKQSRQAELVNLQDRIQTFRQNASTELDKKQSELSAPVMAKINKAISEIAAEGKYLYIFNYLQQVFIYQAPDANDVTALVKKKLGLDRPVETKKATEAKPAATKPAETKKK